MIKEMSTRDGYRNALEKLGKGREDIVVIDADLSKSTRTEIFLKNHPERFFNAGVSEQDLMGMAAGLALEGKTVFASTFAIFASGRAWDQVRNTICFDKLNVKIVATHGGISVGPDGASHQAVEDIAILRVIPNMKIIVPSDGVSAEKLILQSVGIPGPFYVRLGRSSFPIITSEDANLEIGKAIVRREGKDVLIIACGTEVFAALEAAKILETENISVGVVDMHTIKPLDTGLIDELKNKYDKIVTVEEHSIIGGLGSAVAEYLIEDSEFQKPFLRLGLDEQYGQSGEMWELLEKYKLDGKGVAESIKFWRRG